MKINHQKLVDYFKYLADNCNEVASFFRMDLTEIIGAFRSSAEFNCMVLESHEGDFSNSSRTQSVNTITWAFTIYTNPEAGNYDEQNNFLSLAEEIGIKIISRIKYDSCQPNHMIQNAFKAERVSWSKVGPVFQEKLYGYRFVGEFYIHEPLVINTDDWADNPTTCNP